MEQRKIKKEDSILFLAKRKPFADDAAELIMLHFKETDIIFGELNDPFPEHILKKKYRYVISYISPWIVPKNVLENSQVAAVNFHPGPPEYPGIGCTNFALYNCEKEFGITVHHMKENVDSGEVIMVERFPIFDNDTVYSLTQRCYAYIYIAFIKFISLIVSEKPLPRSTEQWTKKPYTRRELNELCVITADMPKEEVLKRIRATTYPGAPGPFIEIFGHIFDYNSNK
jgi:methionyl-tRNA formyltransferase